MLRAGQITGASIRTDVADATNDYDVSILVNGVVQGSLALAATNDSAFTTALAITFAAGDEVALLLDRTAGTNKSAFKNVSVVLELNEALGI